MEETGGNAGGGGALDISDTYSSEPEVRAPPSSIIAVTATTGNQNEPQVLPAASGTGTPGSPSPVSLNNVVSWHHINTKGAPNPRQGHSALIIHDRFMLTFSGGDGVTTFEDLHTYNLITKEWSRKAATGRIPKGLTGYGMDIYGDQIFIFGGMKDSCILSSDLYELDTVSWDWSFKKPTPPKTGSSPPCARTAHSFTAVNGKFYLFGGLTDRAYSEQLQDPVLLGDLFALQLKDNGWSWDVPIIVGNMPFARMSHSAVAYKDTSSKLIIYGGSIGGVRLGDVHILDVDSNTWFQPDLKGRFPKPRSCHTATLIGTKMFVFGGWTHQPLDQIFDPETETCVKVKPESSNTLFFLDLKTQTWERARGNDGKFWPLPRTMHSAAGTKSKIYFWGGGTGECHPDMRSICHDELILLEVEKPSEAPGKVTFLNQLDENGFVVEWPAVEGADSYILQICPIYQHKPQDPVIFGPRSVQKSTLPATSAPQQCPQARFRHPTASSRVSRPPLVNPAQPRVRMRMPPPTNFYHGTGWPYLQGGTRPFFPPGVAPQSPYNRFTTPQMFASRLPMRPGGLQAPPRNQFNQWRNSYNFSIPRVVNQAGVSQTSHRPLYYYDARGEQGQAAGSMPPTQRPFVPAQAQPRPDRTIINGLAGLADIASNLPPVATTSSMSTQQASPASSTTATTVEATPLSVNQ